MGNLHADREEIVRLFTEKLKAKEIRFQGIEDIFPPDIEQILEGYWNKELGRLVYPVPEMKLVLGELRHDLQWLERQWM